MSPSAKERYRFREILDTHEGCSKQNHTGHKVCFEDEEAEIIRISPLMVIKTKDRIICGALDGRIQCLTV